MELENRRARHRLISDSLAARTDAELAELVGPGGSGIVEVAGAAVFAKRIPLTDLELAHPRSTANLFDLPLVCHFFFGVPSVTRFGFGGPSLNAWRELAANLIITDGVLAGETEAFPMLHHWRVLPGRPPLSAGPAELADLVAELDGSPAVRTRLEALRDATHSLVLFSEQLPYPVSDWLREDPLAKAEVFERQLLEIVSFLRDRELLHLDGQLGNMRSDGERLYFTDFGLAASPRFEVTGPERSFLASIATSDADYAALRLVHWLAVAVCGVPDPKAPGQDWRPRAEFVRRCAEGDLPDDLPPVAVGILTRHAATAWRTFSFYRRLFNDDRHAEYPQPLRA
ncbi:BUD32 family EKC/KEOPS complex subunit [Microlunatus parietis]|uniref:Protein kinase domain-containing protein n=1 Tax=Microlunatus parietis TaxID=682979 RepID=A0A7Y9LDW8_9ACTN|nr:serine/threonine protein phosphatase [Microlunatus parietis]NYE74342.1 hypothetical protein [Microlunatus parietis]